MSTTINVTVGGNGLLQQSRQQIQANRFARLERDIEVNVRNESTAQRLAASPLPSGSQPTARKASPDPAASRRGGFPYLVICNVNNAKDDNFTISLLTGIRQDETELQGLADFSVNNERTAYLWLPQGKTLDAFLLTKPGDYINNKLTKFPPYTEPAYKPPFLLPRLGIRKGDAVRIVMNNEQMNFNGNYGYLYAGFFDAEPQETYVWESNTGNDIYIDVTWD